MINFNYIRHLEKLPSRHPAAGQPLSPSLSVIPTFSQKDKTLRIQKLHYLPLLFFTLVEPLRLDCENERHATL